jgi:hypothetical protein
MKPLLLLGLIILCVLAVYVVTTYFEPVSEFLSGLAIASKTGTLTIGNAAPVINNIYINGSMTTATPTDIAIDLTSNTSITLDITAQVTDNNGDCNTFKINNGTAYLCEGVNVRCDATTANHTIYMNYSSEAGLWGVGNKECNITNNITSTTIAEKVWFFERNGSWTINISVTDGTDTAVLTKNFTINELRSITYPSSGGTIDFGNPNVNQWNEGLGSAVLQNSGNVISDVRWNASNFTSGSNVIHVNGTSFVIDDDATHASDAGSEAEVELSGGDHSTQVYFNYTTGLTRCPNSHCGGTTNATMNIYWHLYIPAGTPVGTYTNVIQMENIDHPG